jgi:T4-like virus tail tube protein gp19
MTSRRVERIRGSPYRNFRFRVRWGDRHVAGFGKLSPRRPPSQTKFEAVTLGRGVTHDAEFDRWASKVTSNAARRDLRIEVYGEDGRLTIAYRLLRAWVSEYEAVPDLDANANAVAIEHLKLQHEGFERDEDVPEPKEP